MTSQMSILNPYPQKLPGPSLLHELVRQDVSDKMPALDYQDERGDRHTVTYETLHHKSDILASHLRLLRDEKSLPPTERFIVPVFIGQCPELYMTQLAILKAGGAFCPITLDVPEERLRFILQDTSAPVLVTTTEVKSRLPQLENVSVFIADEILKGKAATSRPVSIEPSMPAYVMYTSGSTGQPKGVLLSHSAATQALLAHDRHIPTFSRFLQFASPTFDVSVFEIFFPLFRGCTLVVCERKRMLNDLPATINALNVDAAELTPSVANSLLQGRESVPKLKVLLTIGEMLKQSVVEDFGGSADQEAVLHGMYGPTEATIHCTLQPDFAVDMPVNNIGIPLDTVSAFVIRPASPEHPTEVVDILPAGEEGELAVGGYQLADGYLNRDEQTKAAFVFHPEFGQLYRTGDRAKLDSQQRLMCLGRISSGQVKLRGQRIELGEIEYAASKTPGCRDVVADVISDTLVVFCVANSKDLNEIQISATCRKWLPPYMVPTDILLLESMPYLASGKVDRRTLQGIHKEFRETQDSLPDIAVDDQTQKLADVLNNLLGVDVLRLPTLAAAGIDSLSSIRIASKLKNAGFPQINAADILEARSLADLQSRFKSTDVSQATEPAQASLLHNESTRHMLETHELLSAHLNKIQDIVACTPVQRAMLGETAKDSRAYCNWIELHVNLQQSIQDVERALRALVAHHEMLRAGFVALHDAQHPYASVIWREDHWNFVQQVDEFEYNFTIDNDAELLNPRSIQLRKSHNGTHVLLQLHHSLYDQWSVDILKQDLDTLLRQEQLSERPSYTAVSSFYGKKPEKSACEAEVEFWQTHLQSAALTPLPQLNGEKTSSCLQRSPWSSLAISTSSLKSTATELNLSAPAIFQAAFAYILGLYVGTSDVMYGTVFSGRQIPIPDVEHIVGPCLATLPVRTDLKGARSCKDLVRAIHSQNRSVLRHSETPLADVKRIGQYAPNENMFDALFVWQESTFAKPALVEEIDSADQHELNLVVEVEPREQNVAVRVTFQESRICSKQVDMFIEQLQSVVQQFINLPDASVASLPTALPGHLLAIDNPNPASHPHESGLIAALENAADRTPDAPALVFAESLEENAPSLKTMSFQQMHTRANRVARHLISRNVQPNDLVCVCMDKSLELYVAILAVLKTGAGYLPLLPDTPKDRLSSILQQTPIKVFLCDGSVPEDVRSVVNTEVVDFGMLDFEEYSSESLKLPYNGSHAAYSIFTSGSTGTPKGLVVTQDNLLGNLSTLADIYPVKSGDRLLQACSQAFDVSVFEIFFAFFTGMPLCFARKDDLFFDIEHGIRALEITHLSLTPTVAALVNPDHVPSVRFLVTAGEAMTDVVHRMWAGRGLHQGYGPSETTNICTVNPQMPKSDIISNIGPAFANTSAFVIRDDGPFEILPFGAVGELAFGGEQVFRGYIGRDDLNAEKIIDHQEFGRVYRSGDIGRMLPDGTILISGRLDDQVKVRGNRIELGEINASLLSLDSVKDCTTMVLGKDAASQSIVTFWIPEGIATNDFKVVRPSEQLQRQIAAIYQTLEGSLPPYMIPTAMIPMTTLPRTTQGKLDKRRLEAAVLALEEDAKAMYFRSSGSGDNIDGDWTPKELELAATLAGVMDISSTDISRNASFFALGLNSINAIAYAKAIEKRLNERVAVGTILRNASIARLGNVLAAESPQDERKTTKLSQVFSGEFVQDVHTKFASGTLNVVAVLPCTPLQEAMLSAGASQSGDAYSNRTTFRVMGDLIRLKDTWQELMRRHAILRTRFCETPDPDHPFAQAILEGVELPWTHIGGDTTVNGYGHDGEKVQIDSHHPFHLVAESTKDGEWLTLLMHHAIYDGTSMSVLLKEAEALYHHEPIPDAPGFTGFLEEVENQAAPAAMNFWSSYIHGFNAKPFPLRSEADGSNTQERFNMPLRTPMKDINDFSKRYGVNSASLFQATWVRVLRIAQGADDLCFGDVVSGRSVPVADVDRLVAPCFNTVPIRATVKDSQTSIDLVRSLHRQRLTIDPYQLAPLRRIQAQSNTPDVHLFDSLMLVQPPSSNLDDEIWSMHEDEGLMDLPLVLELVQGQELAQLVIHYETRYLSQDTASLIAEAFAGALEDSVRYPSSSALEFPFSNAKSLENLLATTLKPSEDVSMPQGTASAETWNEAEKLVRQALSQFSKVDEAKIQKHTSIYRLGLDSLNAVQVASRLRSKGLAVTAADVLEHRTPAAIASAAANANIEDDSKIDLAKYDLDHRTVLLEPLEISASAVEALRPCTAAQNGMLAQSLQSQGSLYVNHISYEIPENVSTEQVRSAWRHVQRKHQALRMGFAQTEEAHCPFAIIIYGDAAVQVPVEASRHSDAETSHEIVQTIHRPAWRLSIDEDSAHRKMTLSMHHALYDAESLQLLLSDFNLALQDVEIGTASNIDAVLQPMLAGANGARGEAEQFWRDHLENAAATPFPSLNPVMSTKTDLYSLHSVSTLSYESLEALCKTKGCTIQAAGQSAWALLLSAYLGEGGVTFGTVFSGRTGSPNDSVVFPSLTTLPVFCNTTKANSDILADMTSFNGSAQRHKFVPLTDIQRFAGLSGQSLFDTVFVYQKSAISTSSNLSWTLLKQSAAVDYNVSLELETASTGDVSLGLTVNRGMIPEEHARLLLQQYDHLLVQVLSGDTSAASETSHLYSATPAQFSSLPSSAQLLHEFVEQGAEKTPDRPALEFAWDLEYSPKSRKVWSYKQLNERANQVAHLIQANGARPGGIVAVCMHKCPEATFAFIGILKAGCAFLALDPELPSARREFILQDSGAAVLFVDHEPKSQENKYSTAIVQLSAGILDAFPVSPLQVGPIDPQSTCYCLYTSGTTGTPKGCELTHENAVQAMMAFQKLFAGRWNQNSRWLQFASYWFDVSVLEQFWSWSVGITLVGAPRDLVLDDLTLFIQQLGITHIDLTPSLARILEPEDVPSLWDGVFITGGEALKQEIIEKWGKHRTICNGYGPTEATIGVTMNPFIGPDAKAANIGPAFLNVGSYVFAPGTTTPVLRGAVGELCVSGKLVGKGYLNRPELTAKAFPSLDSGEKIYRTGDLVRQTADGSFLFIGRQDSQAKLRGQRLEIDEIDSVIKTSSNKISDVASLVIKSPGGDKETLVTFFITAVRKQSRDVILETSEEARGASHAALQSCREHLPGYMVPTHILPLNIIPLTVNNKIDGKRLTAFYNELSVSTLQTIKGTSTSTQPLGENERKLCSVLERMLSVDVSQVDRNTNIFSMGLSSVSAIAFAKMLKRTGFSEASVALIMRNPTIGQLTDALSGNSSISARMEEQSSIRQAQMTMAAFDQRYRAAASVKLGLQTEDIEAVAPCTPLQQGLILESLRGDKQPYFNEFSFVVDNLDIALLRKAFQKISDMAQPLRTKFMQTDDGHAQVILRRLQVPWYEHQITEHQPTTATSRRRLQWISRNQQEFASPFELSLTMSPSSRQLTVHLHHALYDGISFDMIMDQVSRVYHGEDVNCGPRFTDVLPYGPLQVLKGADSFWQTQLSNNASYKLPALASGAQEVDPTEKYDFENDVNLDHLCRKLGVSHQSVAQACFAVALHQVAPTVDTYGLVVSGRSIAYDGADKTLGPLFNTIPAPLQLQPGDSWRTLVQRCHDFNVGALPFQHTPLRDIKKWCKRAPSDAVFEVLFVFQNINVVEPSQASSIWSPLEEATAAGYPLAVEFEIDAKNKLHATLVAKRDTADGQALRAILRSIDEALKSLAQDPQRLIADKFSISATRDTPAVNSNGGIVESMRHVNGKDSFNWTPDAKKLQNEIAQLASLDADEVDELSTFFSLGLDSIDAVKLTSRLKKIGLPISVSKLLRAQTIPNILSSLERSSETNGVHTATPILQRLEKELAGTVQLPETMDKSMIDRILPATPSQEALIAEMRRSDFREYYNHDVLQLASGLDLDKLQRALEVVVNRSPILRTCFLEVSSPEIEAVYAQVVLKPQPFKVRRFVLNDVSELDGLLEDLRSEARVSPSALPTKLSFVHANSENYLILSLAHAQYDGHSLALLHQDVQQAYYELGGERRPSADGIIEASLAAVSGEAFSFWRSTLSGTQISRFPETGKSSVVSHKTESVSSITARQARSFCQRVGVSLQSLAQTSWAITLAHYTRRLEAVFGAVLACRDSEESEQIMFPMMNTVAIRAALHGSRKEMLKYMQNVNTDVMAYQRTPLRFIQSAAKSVVRFDANDQAKGLFDTLFIYQHRPEATGDEKEPLYESVGGDSSVEYPVAVEMEAVDESLIFRATCKDSVLNFEGTEELLARLNDVLVSIITAPEEPTVEFKGAQASICGLPFAQYKAENLDAVQVMDDVPHDNEELETSTEATVIRDALSKVSKTPPEELSASSTIESIGIDSISAIKVVALLRKQGVKLSVGELVRARTVSGMAKAAQIGKPTSVPSGESAKQIVSTFVVQHELAKVPSMHSIDRSNVQMVLPALAGQIYMLNVWQKTRGQLFFPTFTYSFDSDASIKQLQAAWNTLVQGNDILRTVFCTTGDVQVPIAQVILKDVPDNITFGNDCQSRSAGQPMARLHAIKSGTAWTLKLRIHHALYDAVSLPLLINDLQMLLAGSAPTPLPITQTDFLALALAPSAQSSQKAFWSSYLGDVKQVEMEQPDPSVSQARVEIFKPGFLAATSTLESTARTCDVTLQSLLFAAYARAYATLAKHTQSNTTENGDVVLGIYLSGRSHTEHLLALRSPTLNLVPLLVREAGTTPLLESAKRVQFDLQSIGSAENSAVGLWDIAAWTGVRVDTFVNFLRLPDNVSSDTEGETIQPVDTDRLAPRSYIVNGSDSSTALEVPKELESSIAVSSADTNDVYQHSIDLEATITSKGSLDVGFFCPVDMTGLDAGERVLGDLKAELESLGS